MKLPRIVEEENNPDVLRAFLKHTISLVNSLEKQNKELLAEKTKKDQATLQLDDQLLVLRKRMFGTSSEKRESGRPRSEDSKQLSLHSESLAPPPDEKELGKLIEIQVAHELSESELSDIAEQYGFPRDSQWECLNGFYDESEEVDIRVESYVRKKHRRFKYRLKSTKGSDREVIVTAPAPVKIMPGSKYSIDFCSGCLWPRNTYTTFP